MREQGGHFVVIGGRLFTRREDGTYVPASETSSDHRIAPVTAITITASPAFFERLLALADLVDGMAGDGEIAQIRAALGR